MKHYLFIVVCLFVANDLLAQSDTIFYDEKWIEIENRDNASFYSIKEINQKENLYIKKDFFISGEKQKVGYFSDSLFVMKTGTWVSYYKNGNEEEKGIYKESKKNGYWLVWHQNGEIKNKGSYLEGEKNGIWTSYYDNNVKKENSSFEDGKEYILSRWNKDGTIQIENGNGIYTEYFDNGKVQSTGKIINEIKDSVWNTYDELGTLENEELYDKGKFINGTSFKDGKEYPYTIKETKPYTKNCGEIENNDDRDFCTMRVIQMHSMNIDYPMEAAYKKIQGKVYASFVIDKDGKVTDVKIIRGVHKILDDEVVEHIKKLPDFIPGEQRGIPVNVKYSIPIIFKLG